MFDELITAAPYLNAMGRLQPQVGILASDATWLRKYNPRWTALMQDMLSDRVNATIVTDALLEKEKPDDAALAEVLFRFHRGICLRSGNEFFPLLLNEFRPINMEFWMRSIAVFGAASNVHLAKRYLELIRAGDVDGAFRRLERSVNEYLSCLEEQ